MLSIFSSETLLGAFSDSMDDHTMAPALSTKLHKRWISRARLISLDDHHLVVSGADEGLLTLSRLCAKQGQPQLTPLERHSAPHTAGIFGLDLWLHDQVATASKDGTVALWQLAGAKATCLHHFSDLSHSVLKTVTYVCLVP
jgi:WD40 repeat protein